MLSLGKRAAWEIDEAKHYDFVRHDPTDAECVVTEALKSPTLCVVTRTPDVGDCRACQPSFSIGAKLIRRRIDQKFPRGYINER